MAESLKRFSALAPILVLSLGLAACADAPPVVVAEPPIMGPPQPRPKLAKARPKGHYKVGPPYQIRGVRYTPQVDYDYDQTGEASWYGGMFHNRLTANGELFDENELSAAHQTLPLPSMVRVTNLDNGRVLTLRVNDRGPFVGERILDVSKKAAKLLGFYKRGLARVRVEILEPESRALAARYGVRHPPKETATKEAEVEAGGKPTS